MKRPSHGAWTALALTLAFALPSLAANARDFVQDQAGMFSSATVAGLNAKIGSFNAQTGKDVVVVTTPSLNGTTLQSAAQNAFAQNSVNGVLIFIAKDDRKDIIAPDRAGAQWFTPNLLRGIRQSMESQFRSENYDAGITSAVDGVLGVYQSHLGSLRQRNVGSASAPSESAGTPAFGFGGFHLSWIWWIVIIVVGWLILRSIFRAFSGPRYVGGAPMQGPMPPGGYGPGYYGGGGWGGGGGFFSGLLGGLGGAWLGNEIFGQHGVADAAQQTQVADTGGGAQGGDASGWQSDAGQADTSGASGGDWGGGGFGDSGGGGGDFGGGGGDSGGGW